METIYTSGLDSKLVEAVVNSPIHQAAHSEQISDNIQVNTLNMRLQQQQVFEAQGPATFCIAVFLEGKGHLSIDGGTPLTIEPGMTVVFHAPRPISGRTVFSNNSHIHCLDLRFSLDYLQSFGIDSLNRLIPMFQHDHSVSDIVMLARPTSAVMLQLANDILQCQMQGITRNIFLQAKSLEALAQVLSILSEQPRPGQPRLSKSDLEKVQQAIQLIDDQFHIPWTISTLAKKVGLNERKLKAGFHRLVQSTVHTYLEQIRLTHAKSLLSAGETITEVSMAVGYANPSHFARRFKQHYTQSPSQWLQSQYSG